MKTIFNLLVLLTFVNHQAYAQKTVVKLDYFYNNEYKTNPDGSNFRFHYIWEDTTLNGYSMWGEMFTDTGAKIRSLIEAPTIENLKKASVYIITDPDNQKESPNPNYMKAADVKIISDWVAQGGVLVYLQMIQPMQIYLILIYWPMHLEFILQTKFVILFLRILPLEKLWFQIHTPFLQLRNNYT